MTKEILKTHFDYALDLATHKCKIGKYEDSKAYLQNAIHNLDQLQAIENERLQLEQVGLQVMQAMGREQMNKWLNDRLVKAYD